jgi:hypothetical protein
MAKVRNFNVWHRDRDQPSALPASHLAVRDVTAEVFANSSFDDFLESLQVSIDRARHGTPQCELTRRSSTWLKPFSRPLDGCQPEFCG